MFTGLIREIAAIESLQGKTLTLKSAHRPKIGDSIAINGACLTVTSLTPDGFSVEMTAETQACVALENYRRGKAHIEPAMRLSDRLEGHIVQGHIDAIGILSAIHSSPTGSDYHFKTSQGAMRYIIPKGSIAIDGVSLTVNELQAEGFRLTIIPHTLKNTLLGDYKIGQRVNIETDMLVRSLAHLIQKRPEHPSWAEIDSQLLSY